MAQLPETETASNNSTKKRLTDSHPPDLCNWNTKRGQNENKTFKKYTSFKYLNDPVPVQNLFALNQVNQRLHCCHKQI